MGLAAGDPEAQSRVGALENGLRELGWVKGRNLSIEYRWAGDGNAVRDHAAELLAMEPDLILANTTPVTAALQKQSRSVPIVFTQVSDPVGQGLVPNLAHPGGNLTGFTSFEFSIGTKWLEALKQAAPRVTSVLLMFNPQSAPFADLFLQPVEAAAPDLSVAPIRAAVRSAGDLAGQRVRRRRRACKLRNQHCVHLSPARHLYRTHSQRGEAGGAASPAGGEN
jgi:putative ABC transport system substrate-binding protein